MTKEEKEEEDRIADLQLIASITRRGCKRDDGSSVQEKDKKDEIVTKEEEEEEIVVEQPNKEDGKEETSTPKQPINNEVKTTPAPFPSRLANNKRDHEDNEIMEMFRKVAVNIPLLDAIKQVPRYAKFLKELCTSKKKLKGNQTVKVGENVSAVLQKRLPQKCEDPGVFTVPCRLGNLYVPRAMLDLGASINVLPYASYKSMGIGTLTETEVILQLADRSIVHPKGVLEDVLVQVNELVFPADFYVLDMGDDHNPNSNSLILGRSFMKTAKTKIDVFSGTFSMEFDEKVVNFNINNVDYDPTTLASLNCIDMNDISIKGNLESSQVVVSDRNWDFRTKLELTEKFKLGEDDMESVAFKNHRKRERFKASESESYITNSTHSPKLPTKTYYEGSGVKYKRVKVVESPTYEE